MTATNTIAPARHAITRVRHDTKMRIARVARVTDLTPHIRRITFASGDLAGFVSAAPDDHVKLFFPRGPGGEPVLPQRGPDGVPLPGAPEPIARDYTPRRYHEEDSTLDIDFVLHGHGPAAAWAANATVGQMLGIGGPRGSQVVADDFDWYLLMGDEAAIPSIARRLEELRPGARAIVRIEVADVGEAIALSSRAALDLVWVARTGAEPGTSDVLAEATRQLTLPPGDGYVWIACESGIAKALRALLLAHFPQVRKEWMKAAGYWKRGAAATHDKIEE